MRVETRDSGVWFDFMTGRDMFILSAFWPRRKSTLYKSCNRILADLIVEWDTMDPVNRTAYEQLAVTDALHYIEENKYRHFVELP